jgi:hypothetical protein
VRQSCESGSRCVPGSSSQGSPYRFTRTGVTLSNSLLDKQSLLVRGRKRRVEATRDRPILVIALGDVVLKELPIATWFSTGVFNCIQLHPTPLFFACYSTDWSNTGCQGSDDGKRTIVPTSHPGLATQHSTGWICSLGARKDRNRWLAGWPGLAAGRQSIVSS